MVTGTTYRGSKRTAMAASVGSQVCERRPVVAGGLIRMVMVARLASSIQGEVATISTIAVAKAQAHWLSLRQAFPIHLNRIIVPPICLKIKTGNNSTSSRWWRDLARAQSHSIICGTRPPVPIVRPGMAVPSRTTSKVLHRGSLQHTWFLGNRHKTRQITHRQIVIVPLELNIRIRWVAARPRWRRRSVEEIRYKRSKGHRLRWQALIPTKLGSVCAKCLF